MSTISIKNIAPVTWHSLSDHTFQLVDEIDIIRIKISTVDPSFREILLPDEIKKMDRFRNPQSRNQFLAARGAVRDLSAKYTGRAPQDLIWNEGPNKKPSWQSPDNGLHFSIAHSGNYALVCFGRNEMGIDIERIQNEFIYTEMLHRCFNAGEIEVIHNSPDPCAMFYLFWTRKEALLKADGMGIHDDLTIVPCLDGAYTKQPGNDWLISSFVMENYMISLACTPKTHLIRYWDFDTMHSKG